MNKVRTLLASVAVVLLVAAGCSSGSSSSNAGPQAGDPEETTDDTVRLVTSDYGPVLATGDGLVVYAFDRDRPGVTTCTSRECAEKWPAVLIDGDIQVGEGLDEAKFSTIERPGGKQQLAIDDRPLYTMADDRPGTALCQGGEDVWWLVNADGSANKTSQPA